MLLFDGYQKFYGTYGHKLADAGGGKLKGTAATMAGEVTVELWYKHLAGKQGLGIVPITEANKVKFAAIDIDQYPLDLMILNESIQRNNLPLVLCRTKSGGAHLYLFLETFTDAKVVQVKMREIAALLGYGNSEIFPKQTSIVAERHDVGSWINMPYFDSAETTRYALDAVGKKLNFIEFMHYARSRIVPFEHLTNVRKITDDILPQGPPCMNHLLSMGMPEGTRNNGLFNVGVYAKMAHGDAWKQHMFDYNLKHVDPPLAEQEVQAVIKSLDKKEFSYTCKQAPCCNYCNMPKCRTLKYGIGQGDLGMPKFGSLTKLLSDPIVWFLEVEGGGRLELTTRDLQTPRMFQEKCLSTLSMMPVMPKPAVWNEMVHQLLQDVNEVPIPDELKPTGMLWQALENFLTGRTPGKVIDDLLRGLPWQHNEFYYFRFIDFCDYLERKKFKAMPMEAIPKYFHDWEFGKKFWNIRGKGVNTLFVHQSEFEHQTEKSPTPEIVKPETILT